MLVSNCLPLFIYGQIRDYWSKNKRVAKLYNYYLDKITIENLIFILTYCINNNNNWSEGGI